MPASEVIVRVREPDRDRYGDALPATEVPDLRLRALVAPLLSSEGRGIPGREGTVVGLTAYLSRMLPTLDVRAGDAMLVRGERYDVDGPPAYWPGKGWQVTLRRAAG